MSKNYKFHNPRRFLFCHKK